MIFNGIFKINSIKNFKCSLLYCQKTNILVDLKIQCSRKTLIETLRCTEYYNQLRILLKYDDEYNIINSVDKEDVIFSKNNELYATNCTTIRQIAIPEAINSCTRDLPIYIDNDYKEIAFLTKSGIIRNNSDAIECSNKKEYFKVGDTEIVKKDKLIKFFSNLKEHVSLVKDMLETDQGDPKDILDVYTEYVSSKKGVRFVFEIVIIYLFLESVIKNIIRLKNKLFNIRRKKQLSENCDQLSEQHNGTINLETKTTEFKDQTNLDIALETLRNASSIEKDKVILSKEHNEEKYYDILQLKCNCNGDCSSSRCTCQKNSIKCGSRCHTSRIDQCKNIDCELFLNAL